MGRSAATPGWRGGRSCWGASYVEAGGVQIITLPTARILGRLRYSSERAAEVQPGAQVGGIDRLPLREARRVPRPFFAPFPFAGRVFELLWLLALGLVAP